MKYQTGSPRGVEELQSRCQDRIAIVRTKLSHPDEVFSVALYNLLYDTDSVACAIKDFRLSDVPVKNIFELTDEGPIHQLARRMSPRHKDCIKRQIHGLLEGGIIIPASPALYFPVVTEGKKYGSQRFCVHYRTLNQHMKPDLWPLPRMGEIFDDLTGLRALTTLDLLSSDC